MTNHYSCCDVFLCNYAVHRRKPSKTAVRNSALISRWTSASVACISMDSRTAWAKFLCTKYWRMLKLLSARGRMQLSFSSRLCVCVCVCIRMCVLRECVHACMCACLCVCMHVCVNVCVHVVCVRACMHACVCVLIYVLRIVYGQDFMLDKYFNY